MSSIRYDVIRCHSLDVMHSVSFIRCDVIWCHSVSFNRCDVIWCHMPVITVDMMSYGVIWCHLLDVMPMDVIRYSCNVMWCRDVIWCHTGTPNSWYGEASLTIWCGEGFHCSAQCYEGIWWDWHTYISSTLVIYVHWTYVYIYMQCRNRCSSLYNLWPVFQ